MQTVKNLKGKLGNLQTELNGFSYPEYANENNPNFNLFKLYFDKYLLEELEGGFFISTQIINGDCPCLRKILLNEVCDFASKEYWHHEIENDMLQLFGDKFKAIKNEGLDEQFEQVLERDLQQISANGTQGLDMSVELKGFSDAVGNLLKNTDNPKTIENHKDLLKFLPDRTQVDIMHNYASVATAFYKNSCDEYKPRPEYFVKDFLYSLFDEKMKLQGVFSPNVSDMAVGALLGHLRRQDIMNCMEDSGLYREAKLTLNRYCYDGGVEEYVKMVPPPNVRTLDEFNAIP